MNTLLQDGEPETAQGMLGACMIPPSLQYFKFDLSCLNEHILIRSTATAYTVYEGASWPIGGTLTFIFTSTEKVNNVGMLAQLAQHLQFTSKVAVVIFWGKLYTNKHITVKQAHAKSTANLCHVSRYFAVHGILKWKPHL